jgi:RND family efflux transporter MFP subunit
MNEKKVRIIFWIALIFTGIAILAFQIGNIAAETEKNILAMNNESSAPIPVKVMRIVPSDWEQWKSYYGQAQSTKKQHVSSYIREIVDEVYVNVGDYVKKGQHLLALQKDDHTANLQASTALYEETKLYYKRLSSLSKKGGVSQAEIDKAYANMKAAEANLRNAKTTLRRTNLYAKTSGVVTTRNVEPGEIAEPGMILLTIEDPGEMEVRMMVSINDIASIKEKKTVRFITNKGSLLGTVKRVASKAQDGSGLFPVLISLKPDSGILPGTYIEGAFLIQKRENAIVIPSKSIINRDRERFVYIVEKEGGEDIIRLTRVDTEAGNKENILVGSGLNTGDIIVVSGGRGLGDGKAVTYSTTTDTKMSK